MEDAGLKRMVSRNDRSRGTAGPVSAYKMIGHAEQRVPGTRDESQRHEQSFGLEPLITTVIVMPSAVLKKESR